MPGRINIKFLLILTAIVFIVIGGGAGYYYISRNAEAWSKRGDEYLDRGEYVEAIKAYGRAMNKKPENLKYTYKYAHANEIALTDNQTDARKYLDQVVGAYQKATTQEPQNSDPFLKSMNLYMKLATEVDSGYFSVMLSRADAKLEQNDMSEARKYRGIGLVQQMTSLEVTDEDRMTASEDLQFTLEQNPDDTEASFYLALWEMMEAKRLDRVAGDPQKAEAFRKLARQRVADDVDKQPGVVKTKLNQVRILLYEMSSDEQMFEQVNTLLAEIETQMLQSPGEVMDLMMLAQLLAQIDRDVDENSTDDIVIANGIKRSEALLAASVEAYPEDIRLIVTHGKYQKQAAMFEQALKSFSNAKEITFNVKPFLAMHFARYQQEAATNYIELLLATSENVENIDEKQIIYGKVEKALKQVVAEKTVAQGAITLLQGKLALAQQDWVQAANLLTRASRELGDRNIDALRLSAASLVRNGQWGEAAKQYERLLELISQYTRGRQELVRIYLRLKQYTDAEKHLDILEQANPTEIIAKSLRIGMFSQMGKHDDAIELALQLGIDKDPSRSLSMVPLYDAADRPDDAMAILRKHVADNPQDPSSLERLLQRIEDKQARQQLIDDAKTSEMNPKLLTLLEQQYVGGGVSTEDVIAALGEKYDNPVDRYREEYKIFVKSGQYEQAQKALTKLEEIQPDHPEVINRRFAEAMMNQNWEQGEKIVERASSINLDQAQGAFFKGRLEASRGELEKAVAFYRQGLQLRPVYYEGWRQLGDLQRSRQSMTDAATAYEKALQQRPDDVASLFGMALVKTSQGDNLQALQLLRKAYVFAPENLQIAQTYMAYEQQYGDADKAMQLRRDHMQDHAEDFSNQISMAKLLAEQDQHEQALQMIDQVIEKQQQNLSNTLAKAQILAENEKVDEGRKFLLRYVNSLEEDEQTDLHWVEVARYLLANNQFDAAMSAYRRAVELEDPKLRPVTRELAQRLMRFRKFDEAVKQFQSLLETNPEDRAVALALIETLINSGQNDKAEQQLKQFIDEHGADATALLLDASLKKANGDYLAARNLYDRAAELAPKQAVVFLSRGLMLAENPDQDDAAINDLKRAVELNPQMYAARLKLATIYSRRGDSRDAVRELKQVILKNPKSNTPRIKLMGIYTNTNDRLSAKRVARESIEATDSKGYWYGQLAELELQDKNYKKAIELLKQTLDLDISERQKVEIISRLAMAQIDDGKPADALNTLRSNPAQLQESSQLKTVQVLALWAFGELNKANVLLQNVLAKSKSYGEINAVARQLVVGLEADKTIEFLQGIKSSGEHEIWVALIIAELDLGEKRFEKAYNRLTELEQLIKDYPNEKSSYQMIFASAAHQYGQSDQAIELYDQLLETFPQSLTVHNNYAFLLIETGNYTKGLDMAKKAFLLGPDNPLVLDTLGWALLKAGQPENARKTLLQSIEIERSAANCYHLAEVLFELRDSPQARDYLNKAQQLAEKSNDNLILDAVRLRQDEIGN